MLTWFLLVLHCKITPSVISRVVIVRKCSFVLVFEGISLSVNVLI